MIADRLFDEVEHIAVPFHAEIETPARPPLTIIIKTAFLIEAFGDGVDASLVDIGRECTQSAPYFLHQVFFDGDHRLAPRRLLLPRMPVYEDVFVNIARSRQAALRPLHGTGRGFGACFGPRASLKLGRCLEKSDANTQEYRPTNIGHQI